MKTNGNTILITGGATGIGLAIAEKFLNLNNTVIICGRREDRLSDAKKRFPNLNIKQCDVSKPEDREDLHDWISENFKDLNILINNAGIQRPIDFRKGTEDLLRNEDEIDINLKAQIYLSAIFIPDLLNQKDAAIMNVSSGLGFIPIAIFPIYCATKAAIHSFSMSLRHQLRETSIKIFEIIPPTVHDTELKGKPINKTDYSVSASEIADAVIKGIENNEFEIPAGSSKNLVANSKNPALDQMFKNMNH